MSAVARLKAPDRPAHTAQNPIFPLFHFSFQKFPGHSFLGSATRIELKTPGRTRFCLVADIRGHISVMIGLLDANKAKGWASGKKEAQKILNYFQTIKPHIASTK